MVFILWIAAELLMSLRTDRIGPSHAGAFLTGFLAATTTREWGVAMMARRAAVVIDRAVLWPLGSLTLAHAPRRQEWQPPAPAIWALSASAVFALLTAGIAWLASGRASVLLFNPLWPALTAGELRTPLAIVAWWWYAAGVLVLCANLVLPTPVTDLGRLIDAGLSRALGRDRASLRVSQLGMMCGMAAFLVGAVGGVSRLVAVAAALIAASILEYRRARFLHDPLSGVGPPSEETRPDAPEASAAAHTPARADAPPRADDDSGALDRVLEKVSRAGLGSLTPEERGILEHETRRRRGE